jgi:hypothetical protein
MISKNDGGESKIIRHNLCIHYSRMKIYFTYICLIMAYIPKSYVFVMFTLLFLSMITLHVVNYIPIYKFPPPIKLTAMIWQKVLNRKLPSDKRNNNSNTTQTSVFIQETSSKTIMYDKFEDTKGEIRSSKSKDRQHNIQMKRTKWQATIYKTLHRKLKIEQDESH